MHTASIIKEYINVPIIEDARFNEAEGKEDMNSGALWQRTMDGIQDIVDKYDINDDILVVTSGVNLTGFICYFYNIDPKSNPIVSQGATCSPVNFIINEK
jgi:broad specificity phosphatase PhoE